MRSKRPRPTSAPGRLQIFWEIELPLAMPGVLIGSMLTFILVLGSLAESKILGGQAIIMIADDIESAFTFAQNWPKGSVLSVLLIAFSGALGVFSVPAYRPRPDHRQTLSHARSNCDAPHRPVDRVHHRVLVCADGRGGPRLLLQETLFQLSDQTVGYPLVREGLRIAVGPGSLRTSLSVALLVTLFSVLLAFCGALAFARYDWRGRKLYQKLVLLPIFFPQAVLGLALLLWFSAIGVTTSWLTAVFAHMIWIVPIVTLIMSIQAYSFDPALEEAAMDMGATRWQVLREVTLPILAPGIISGALFAFLLSWGNFPLSLFSTGADQTIPEWLYAKMVSGYTPIVPTLGALTIGGASVLIAISYAAFVLLRARDRTRSLAHQLGGLGCVVCGRKVKTRSPGVKQGDPWRR